VTVQFIRCVDCGFLTPNDREPLYCANCNALLRAAGYLRVAYGNGEVGPQSVAEVGTDDSLVKSLLATQLAPILDALRRADRELSRLRQRVLALERAIETFKQGGL
jgi:hypothetical protein